MKRKGFSLIELLVVIAIIALLISIVAPALQAVKKQARSVVCGSNISQLAMNMSIYVQENRTFPFGFDDATSPENAPPGGHLGNAAYDKIGWWWLNYILEDKIKKDSAAWCPSRDVTDLMTRINVLCENYGINRSICKDAQGITGTIGNEFVGKPLSDTQVRNPSHTLLIVDSGYSLVSWKAATNAISPHFDNPKREGNFYVPGMSLNKSRPLIDYKKTPQAIYGRHPKAKINVGYSDGHVSRIEADNLNVGNSGSGFTNINALWLGK